MSQRADIHADPSDSALAPLWARIESGSSAAVLGTSGLEPPSGGDLLVLRLDCGASRSAFSLVRQLLDAIGQILEESPSRWLSQAAGLGGRLLEGHEDMAWGSALVFALRELGDRSQRTVALLCEGVDRAPQDVCELLAELIARRAWLAIPLLLTAASTDPEAPAARDLIALIAKEEGEDAVVRLPAPEEEREPPLDSHVLEAPLEVAIEDIPPEILRVLRALAVASPEADIDALAALLDSDPLDILERLQAARDLGIDLVDREAGFALEPDLAEALRATLLPSLARAYHRRLADWHASGEPLAPGDFARPYGVTGAVGASTRAPAAPAVPADEPRAGPAAEALPGNTIRWAEAASHAEAAGESELAVSQYVRAVDEAVDLGLFAQALIFGENALAALDRGPRSEARRRLRIEAYLALARLHWKAAGVAPGLSLERAQELLAECEVLRRPGDAPALAASLEALRARVLYDVGSPEALAQALAAVGRAGAAFREIGDELRAARLANDEAAIRVRLGDPFAAQALLVGALEVFSRSEAESAEAQLAEAETLHLLARLVLHLEEGPRREADLVGGACEHARGAARIYEELDRPRELARVHETLGRLELRLGHLDRAEEHLAGASAAQQQRGDPLGLARTAAALAEVRQARGDATSALDLLGESVRLNALSRSPRGLAYNRRSLESLASRLPGDVEPIVEELLAELAAAEAVVGRTELIEDLAP